MSNFPNALADGRYLLVQPLGEGGMASVFRGWDQRLQVWRAVKVLAPQYADKPRLRGRFENEAQTMANLEHKHIVRVYDVGSDGPFAYIVMELLEGGSLVDWLERNGPMPPRLAVDVTLEICLGLSAAHEKGVVHRDIKPHNILITRDGTCRVTDFGIAQVSQNDQSLTKTGAVMGTWGYMAPEQRTNAKGVDARADVYATTATLFTLLSNKLPADLFFADRDPEMLEDVHPALHPIIIKGCDYDRNRRYGSAMELASALAEVFDSLPENGPEVPPLAQPPREAPPIPRPSNEQTMVGTPTPAPARRSISSPTPAQPAQAAAGNTIVAQDIDLHAPTRAPFEGATLDRPGPQQHVPVYAPGQRPALTAETMDPSQERPPERKGTSWFMIGGGMVVVAAIVLVVAITSSTIATVLAINIGAPETPIEKPIVADVHPPEKPPEVVVPEKPPEKPPETVTAEKPPEKPPEAVTKPPEKPPEKVVKPKSPDPKAVIVPEKPPEKPPEKVVIATNPEPPVTTSECVRLETPINSGGEVIFKGTVCESTPAPVLYFRGIGQGSFASQPMVKALGRYTTKVKLDGPTATGLEYYVKAGGASQGSASSPYTLRTN